ncbi:MAG: methyltransferase domain-containing protein, partial [Caldilineaceae bacterium]
LARVLTTRPDRWRLAADSPAPPPGPVTRIVYAITSANQAHSRYNPIPFHIRAIGADRFARALAERTGVGYRIFGIPHYPPTSHFAEIVLKEIVEQSEGELNLTPETSAVVCSTPQVAALYAALGFALLPCEWGDDSGPLTPVRLVQSIAAAGPGWADDPAVTSALHPESRGLWQQFPEVPRRLLRLWQDPLLGDEGDLTGSRNYSAYAYGMGNNEIIDLKYQDVAWAIRPGRIVDEGCADGRLLERIAADFPDSDLIGIEITGEFIARGLERQRAGAFGDSFVHFHQRNITQPLFQPDSINTTLCNSTLHELWSYNDGETTVRAYLAEKFRQTRPGGRLLIRDVVGPVQKERPVFLWLNDADGSNASPYAIFDTSAELATHLEQLSTHARFLRFVRDFHAPIDDSTPISGPGGSGFFLPLAHAVEFMTKKDYTANWASEMHESFAFWDFGQWKAALTDAGFRVLENPTQPAHSSRIYTNPWIVEKRWQGKVALYAPVDDGREVLAWPPTTVILAGEKPKRASLT